MPVAPRRRQLGVASCERERVGGTTQEPRGHDKGEEERHPVTQDSGLAALAAGQLEVIEAKDHTKRYDPEAKRDVLAEDPYIGFVCRCCSGCGWTWQRQIHRNPALS